MNLHPESTKLFFIAEKFEATFSNESVEMIPPNCSDNEANDFPSFITTRPHWVLIRLFAAIAISD